MQKKVIMQFKKQMQEIQWEYTWKKKWKKRVFYQNFDAFAMSAVRVAEVAG